MKAFSFGPEHGRHIQRYGSNFVLSRLAHTAGIHVGCMRLGPGGRVGYHPASTYQLFAVVAGEGWVRGAARLLVVAAYRDVEAQQRAEVAEAIGDLVREGPSIHLRGFGRAEVRRLLERLTGMRASEDAVARIYDATGGNPLFIRELVRLVGRDAAPGWRGHPAISAGVRAVIHQRLAGPRRERHRGPLRGCGGGARLRGPARRAGFRH